MSYAFEGMDRNRDGTLPADELPGGRGKPVTRQAHLAQLAERFRRQGRGPRRLSTRNRRGCRGKSHDAHPGSLDLHCQRNQQRLRYRQRALQLSTKVVSLRLRNTLTKNGITDAFKRLYGSRFLKRIAGLMLQLKGAKASCAFQFCATKVQVGVELRHLVHQPIEVRLKDRGHRAQGGRRKVVMTTRLYGK